MPPESEEDRPVGQAPTGVDRLIHGHRKPEKGKSSPFGEEARKPETRALEVPSWIYYQVDVVLITMALWVIVTSDSPMEPRRILLCLGLTLIAACVGAWPWLRNALYNQSLSVVDPLPEWGVMAAEPGARKHLMVHLRKPFFVVIITRTSWDTIRARPYWLDGPPNLSPSGTDELLDDAKAFFRKWEKPESPSEEESPAEIPDPPTD